MRGGDNPADGEAEELAEGGDCGFEAGGVRGAAGADVPGGAGDDGDDDYATNLTPTLSNCKCSNWRGSRFEMNAGHYIVRNDVSEAGLQRVHALRAGKPVDLVMLLEELGKRREEVMIFEYEERETGMWHLRIYWKEGEDNECVQAEETEISELKR